MSELGTSRHWWSWRSCFATVKHSKKKAQKKRNSQSNQQKLSSNDQTHQKRVQTVDENSNILSDFDFTSNDYNHPLIPNDYMTKNENSTNEMDSDEQAEDSVAVKIINQKPSITVRSTPLDAIEEDLNEENPDEFDEAIQSVRLCCDRELIDDATDLHTRLSALSRKNHVVIQLNENGYLLGEFTRQLGKFKLKIDDIKRASTEIPRDAELLEARYSTLLATIESLSLLLKVAQISSSRALLSRLINGIEERMEQLNKIVQLSSSINFRQQGQELDDDDFLSFRSALSSYEHLLNIV